MSSYPRKMPHRPDTPRVPAKAFSNIALVPPSVAKRSAAALRVPAKAREEQARLKVKVEQANTILDRLELRAVQQNAAQKELAKRKAATLARIVRIEDAILQEMHDAGLDKVFGIRCTMRSQPAPASLEVVNSLLIPKQYMVPPKPAPASPDKVAIKKALAADDDLDPAAWGVKLNTTISLIRK